MKDSDGPSVCARALRWLIENRQVWIRRRTDRYYWLDDRRLAIRRRFEVQIPDMKSCLGDWSESDLLLPLCEHEKKLVSEYQVTDEGGRLCVSWTPPEDRPLIAEVLEDLAGNRKDPEVLKFISRITGNPAEAEMAWACRETVAIWPELADQTGFFKLAEQSVKCFQMLVPVKYDVGAHRIFQIEEEYPVFPQENRILRKAPREVTVVLPGDMAMTCQIEFAPIAGLRVDAEIAPQSALTIENETTVGVVLWRSDEILSVKVAWRLVEDGVGRTAEYIAGFTTFLLFSGVVMRVGAQFKPVGDGGILTTVLAVIPAIYAVVVFVVERHELTARNTRSARAHIALAGGIIFVAALSLAVKPSQQWIAKWPQMLPGWRLLLWGGLTGLSALVTALVVWRRRRAW